MDNNIHSATIILHSIGDQNNISAQLELSDQPDADYIPSSHTLAQFMLMSLRKHMVNVPVNQDVVDAVAAGGEHLTGDDMAKLVLETLDIKDVIAAEVGE